MQRSNRRGIIRKVVCAAAFAVLSGGAANAQQAGYPSKQVRMILPFAPGGPSDIIGRLLSRKLTEQMGQAVITDNAKVIKDAGITAE